MAQTTSDSGDDFLKNGEQLYLRHLSIDCVIFGFHENELKVLLLKWNDGPRSLPGGFVKKEESLDDAAIRVLRERTGLKDIFLRQFYTFGDPQREKNKYKYEYAAKGEWIKTTRFISVGYYALVEFSKVNPRPDIFSEDCQWIDIASVPKLVFDHNAILTKALETLRLSLNDHPIGYTLLPEKFTMPELQRLYETILGTSLDRRNFQKKMLGMEILQRLQIRKTGGAHKAPFLYRFDKKKYERAMKLGLIGF